MDTLFSIASLLVSSIHETFVGESRWFGGGAIVESVFIIYFKFISAFPNRKTKWKPALTSTDILLLLYSFILLINALKTM